MERNTHTIDAEGKSVGRLAVQVAGLLRGKQKMEFASHKDVGDAVVVKNVGKMKVTGRKLDQKVYSHHSGYPGGLRQTPMRMLMEKTPDRVLRAAVWGMLPKNRLRTEQIKRLKTE